MLSAASVPVRAFGLAGALSVTLLAGPVAAQTERQTCLYADVTTTSGPRLISEVFCVSGPVNSTDVMHSFGIWRRGAFQEDELASWGQTRVTSIVFPNRAAATAGRRAAFRRLADVYVTSTTGWTYVPGAAPPSEGLGDLTDGLDRIVVSNGFGVSIGSAHGNSRSLTIGGSVRFSGRWRVHVHNPIAALSAGESIGSLPGQLSTYRRGWGMELLRHFTPQIALGIGVHDTRVVVREPGSGGIPVTVSDSRYWDPTVSLTLPLGYIPVYFRYGTQSRYSIGLLVDF